MQIHDDDSALLSLHHDYIITQLDYRKPLETWPFSYKHPLNISSEMKWKNNQPAKATWRSAVRCYVARTKVQVPNPRWSHSGCHIGVKRQMIIGCHVSLRFAASVSLTGQEAAGESHLQRATGVWREKLFTELFWTTGCAVTVFTVFVAEAYPPWWRWLKTFLWK